VNRSDLVWVWSAGVIRDFEVLDDEACVELMTTFIAADPDLWNEDIGE
jgi:creatinine deaminase